jgi:hypothetical protein
VDVLDEHSEALGNRLAPLMRLLIDEDLSVMFYELTTVEVTGQSELEGDVRLHGTGKPTFGVRLGAQVTGQALDGGQPQIGQHHAQTG